jgi:hypothetical protein
MPIWTSCPLNTKTWRTTGTAYTFTDPTITALSTKPRKIYIDELRAAINQERYRRNNEVAYNYAFTDPVITALTTKIRKPHIDDIRLAIADTNAMTCPSDVAAAVTWTDPVITALVTKIRKPHIDEARVAINSLRAQCICNCEFCNYCSDCGNMAGCGCDDSQGTECTYFCSARNTHPTTQNPPTPWCVYNYGVNWVGGASGIASYGCMCSRNLGPCGAA